MGRILGVTSLCYARVTLWSLGYLDQALDRSREALALAREFSHPFSLAYARFFAAMLHQFRLEGQLTQAWGEAAIALSSEQEFPLWLPVGPFCRPSRLAGHGGRVDALTFRTSQAALNRILSDGIWASKRP